MTAAFFGHRDTPESVRPKLKETLISLIENDGAKTFYVGSEGRFDSMVKRTLKELKEIYPNISYYVVLAYMPTERKREGFDYSDTILPEEVEKAPKRYAIDKRNRWLVERSDVVVTYVRYTTGGAAKFKELAEKKGKRVINLAG